jgi:hypothetical protein
MDYTPHRILETFDLESVGNGVNNLIRCFFLSPDGATTKERRFMGIVGCVWGLTRNVAMQGRHVGVESNRLLLLLQQLQMQQSKGNLQAGQHAITACGLGRRFGNNSGAVCTWRFRHHPSESKVFSLLQCTLLPMIGSIISLLFQYGIIVHSCILIEREQHFIFDALRIRIITFSLFQKIDPIILLKRPRGYIMCTES